MNDRYGTVLTGSVAGVLDQSLVMMDSSAKANLRKLQI